MKRKDIDGGKQFDWGRTSAIYARYRDIYPQIFYDKITRRGLCLKGQNVLDLGTGTGVLPRNMYKYGANWTGIDISPEQIEMAKLLAGDMNITFKACAAEQIDFADGSFHALKESLRALFHISPRQPAYPGHEETGEVGRAEG